MERKDWKTVDAKINGSIFRDRMELHRRYMLALDERRLLASYFMEAGLNSNTHYGTFPKHYGGWEEPDEQVRGSFSGHYMSACAYFYKFENDTEMKRRGDLMVDYLEECQKENENNWVGSIPSLYLERIARNKWVWAPQYMIHKTFMGLIDMYRYAGNEKALQIADRWSDWFVNWTNQFDGEQLAKLADWESGGLMESWADLYAITGNEKYKILAGRYYRSNLFDPLIRGEDALTFKHANTSLPEAHGCARAYEVTGDEKYRKAVEAFWHFGFDTRDQWASGGQNNREMWVSDLTENISSSTQEFCTAYNTIRLAEYLFRWTGEAKYADCIERLFYNGVLAQQNKDTADICYFLPMSGGSKKSWLDRYNTFYCCCGTMLQAQSSYGDKLIYQNGDTDTVCIPQYIPFTANTIINGSVNISVSMDFQQQPNFCYEIIVSTESSESSESTELSKLSENDREFTLRVRKPEWSEKFGISINGEQINFQEENGWIDIRRVWNGKTAVLLIPEYRMIPVKLGELDNRSAFRFGPILMAALSDGEYALYGNADETAKSIDTSKIIPADRWFGRDSAYITNKRSNFKLIPIYRITNEAYQVYFPFIKSEE